MRQEAAAQYREEVARELKQRRGGRRWGWAAAFLLLAGLGGGAVWWRVQPSNGVGLEPLEAAFVQNCEAEVVARVGEGWTFPAADQIKAALNVSAEGRSWQGIVLQGERKQSFSCLGQTVGSGEVRLELFGEELP